MWLFLIGFSVQHGTSHKHKTDPRHGDSDKNVLCSRFLTHQLFLFGTCMVVIFLRQSSSSARDDGKVIPTGIWTEQRTTKYTPRFDTGQSLFYSLDKYSVPRGRKWRSFRSVEMWRFLIASSTTFCFDMCVVSELISRLRIRHSAFQPFTRFAWLPWLCTLRTHFLGCTRIRNMLHQLLKMTCWKVTPVSQLRSLYAGGKLENVLGVMSQSLISR